MESEGDKASHQHPKRSILANKDQFSSKSVKDSILTLPILPPELITEILLRLPVKSLLKFRFVKDSMIYNPKDASFRYSEVIDFRDVPVDIAIYVESLVCPFSKEGAADATKHKRLKKLRSRKPSNKNLK